MAALLTIALLLLCCSISASEGKCDYNVATGDDFAVPLDKGLKGLKKIRWKHNNKYVLDGRINGENITVLSGTESISPNGSLTLKKVDKSKAGTYTPELYNTDGQLIKVEQKSLCVIDRVTKPNVMVQCGQKPKESQVTFTCSFKEKDLQIEWLKNKEVINNMKAATLMQDGKKVERDSFSCSVSNAVSSMVSEPVIQTCFKSQFGFLYDKVMGVQVWIIIASGGGVVLMLILTIVVCCIMNKRKRHMNLKEKSYSCAKEPHKCPSIVSTCSKQDEEELRLDWTNTEQQQQHHSHNHNHKHHPHNPPPGHAHPHPQHQHQQQHQQQSAGHTGPRQNRSRQQREQRPRLPEPPGSLPQPSPRRPAQGPGPAVSHDDEQPPPLPQPRKKAPV